MIPDHVLSCRALTLADTLQPFAWINFKVFTMNTMFLALLHPSPLHFTTYRYNEILVQSAIISVSAYFPNHSVNTILLMDFKSKELFLELFPLASLLFRKKAKTPPGRKGLKEGWRGLARRFPPYQTLLSIPFVRSTVLWSVDQFILIMSDFRLHKLMYRFSSKINNQFKLIGTKEFKWMPAAPRLKTPIEIAITIVLWWKLMQKELQHFLQLFCGWLCGRVLFLFFMLFFVKAKHLVSKQCFNEQPIRRDLPES